MKRIKYSMQDCGILAKLLTGYERTTSSVPTDWAFLYDNDWNKLKVDTLLDLIVNLFCRINLGDKDLSIADELKSFIFLTPVEKMPLFIQAHTAAISAEWRLKINKYGRFI